MTVRRALAAAALALPHAFAGAFDIEAALDLGQQVALSACETADPAGDAESVRVIEADFRALVGAAAQLGLDHQPELVIARCRPASPAQVLAGKVGRTDRR